MSTLTLRQVKGSPLTNAEVDANFTNLLVAIGGANTAPYTVPTPTGTGSPVLSASPTFTGTVSGITKSMVVLSNVDNTTDANKPVSSATQTALNLKADLASPTFTGTVLLGTGANLTRFPNAIAVVSNTSAGIQQNEPHNIGLMAEATANSSNVDVYGIGLYGVGYTAGATRSGGVVGEAHVSASADTGAAIGVRGYSHDTHSGGINVGLYGNAYGSTVNNYALYMNAGDIYSGAAQTWTLGGGNLTLTGGDLIVGGNLTVNGTTTTINSTIITVDDKNLELGSVASPTDVTANGGGITLKAASDKTFSWVSSTNRWTSNVGIEISAGQFTGSGAGLTSIPLATAVSGTLSVTNGGTGVTTSTGSGSLVLSTSASLTTPILDTPTSGNLTNCTVDGTYSVGFREVPQVSQSANYIAVLSDSGKHLYHPSADTTARTFTIPSNASVAYPIGAVLMFVNDDGAGVLTIAIDTDTLRLAGAGTTGSRTLAANGVATAVKVTSTSWIISGTNLT
jgi:hypothetical protein